MKYKSWKTHKCKFKEEKPLKYIYPNQEAIRKEVIEFIIPYLEKYPFFSKVWIWGSLAKKTFGIYEKPYGEQEASDIDFLVEVDENYNIPPELKELKNWVKKRTYSRAFYSNIKFVKKLEKNKKVKHKSDFICHFPSKNTKSGFYNKVKDSKLIYSKGELSFSIFTDVHYDPRKIKNTSKGIKGEESVKNFPKLIEILKKRKQEFIVNLGDLVEAEPKRSFPKILKNLQKIPTPTFHVIGNHELELLSIKELKGVLKLKKFYYSKEIKGFKLIFLNSFDTKASKPDHRRKSRVIGGDISDKQIEWLKNELKSTKGKAIIFTHKLLSNQKLKNNPIWAIAPERYTKVENASEIRKILEKSKKVLAVFQGHIHQNSMIKINKIPYFTIQSFCQNKNYSPKQKASKSFAIIKIKDDSLIVDIKGDKKTYKVSIS